MKAHIAYLKYLLRHKWFVFLECLKLGVPLWIAVWHDWDKFLPDEWFPYVKFFYFPDGTKRSRRDKHGYYNATEAGEGNFNRAWFLHAARNKHHWQYWCLVRDGGIGVQTFDVPDVYRREMLADWRGAGRAQGTPDTKAWYEAHRDDLILSYATKKWIEGQLYGKE